jgi:hypothetical protein
MYCITEKGRRFKNVAANPSDNSTAFREHASFNLHRNMWGGKGNLGIWDVNVVTCMHAKSSLIEASLCHHHMSSVPFKKHYKKSRWIILEPALIYRNLFTQQLVHNSALRLVMAIHFVSKIILVILKKHFQQPTQCQLCFFKIVRDDFSF